MPETEPFQMNASTDPERRNDAAVVLLNDAGDIIDVHETCAAFLGWDRAELNGQSITRLLECGRELLLNQLAQIGEEHDNPSGNTAFSVRVLVRRGSGKVFPANVSIKRFIPLGCWIATFDPVAGTAIPAAASETGEPRESTQNEPRSLPESDSKPKSGFPLFRNRSLLRSANRVESTRCEVENDGKGEEIEVLAEAFDEGIALNPANKEISETPVGDPSADDESAAEVLAWPEPQAIDPNSSGETQSEPEISEMETKIEAAPAGKDAIGITKDLAGKSGEPIPQAGSELDQERAERKRMAKRVQTLSEQVQSLLRQAEENVESERAYQERIEEIEARAETLSAASARDQADLERKNTECQDLECQLEAARHDCAALEENRAKFEETTRVLRSIQSQLEEQLKTSREQQAQTQNDLRRETEKRMHLEVELAISRIELEKHHLANTLEVAKLESELQLSRIGPSSRV